VFFPVFRCSVRRLFSDLFALFCVDWDDDRPSRWQSSKAADRSDSMIARELRLSPNPVRRLRKRLGLPAHVRKAIPIGTRYGNLIVQKAVSRKRKKTGPVSNSLASRSLCQCDCGGQRIVFNEDLRSGNTTTCGRHINVRNLDSEWIRVFHQYLGGAPCDVALDLPFPSNMLSRYAHCLAAIAALKKVMWPCLPTDATVPGSVSGTTESTNSSLVSVTAPEMCCLAAAFVIAQRAIWPWRYSFLGFAGCSAKA
jgi:hypothetical protein